LTEQTNNERNGELRYCHVFSNMPYSRFC